MSNNPKISIITVTFNSENTLDDTLKSIRIQNYKNYEYIVVDGGSTDHTLDIISHNRDIITKYISEPDKGISDAFNKGIRMSTGEIIGIINSDDMLAKNALEIIAANIYQDTDIFYGNCIMFGGNEPEYRFKPFPDVNILKERMALVHPSTFVRKAAYDKYGLFDLKYKCQMDRELLLRMLIAGAKFQYVDEDLAKMRLGGVNQRTYLERTIPEGTEISIKYGLSPIKAKTIAFKCRMRFRVVNFVRKFRFAKSIRKILHSKNTEMNI